MNSDQNPYDSGGTNDLRSGSSGGNQSSGGEFQPYLIHNIIVLAMCCMPLGIWGVITAREAERLNKNGDPRAHEMASKARSIFIGGMVSGLVVIGLYIGLSVAAEM